MLDKPSKEEDEYFAREEIEKKRKLAYQQAQVMAEPAEGGAQASCTT